MIDFKKTTLELIQMGEGLTVEFKRTLDSPYRIAKTLAAFANTSGGILLIGVNDNRETVGITSELKELQKLDKASSMLIESELLIRYKIIDIGLKKIIRVEIEESQDKPHYALNEKGERIIYIRTRDRSVPTNRLMLPGEGDTATEKLLTSRPVRHLIQYLKQKDSITDKELSHLINVSEKRAGRLLQDLMEKGVVTRHGSGKASLYSLKLVQ